MIRIFSIVAPARVFTLFISEVLLLFACYIAATYLDPDIGDVGLFLQFDSGLLRIGIVVIIVITGLFFEDLYVVLRVRGRLDLFQKLTIIFGATLVGEGLISYLNRGLLVPRKVMLSGSLMALVALFCWRLIFNSATRNAAPVSRMLFLGASPTVLQLAGYFATHPEVGVAAVGYLETDRTVPVPAALRRLGSIEEMDQVLDNCAPGSIVIGSREDIKPAWVGEFLALRFGGVRVEEASSVYERTFVRKCVSELWPSLLVFGPSLEPNAAMVAFQTAYSAVFAIVVLLLASPLMLAAAALIRFGSRGPVLERQPRTGLHGVPFNLYRFRCRRDEDGACTRVGKVLKRLHLDALPCLFNVVRGEMSIVGPRAVYPLHDEQLSTQIPFYGHRHRVKPGLIGWAFVHPGDSIHDSVRELEYDLYYVENLSPILDSMVLLLSLKIFWLSVTSNSPEAISA